MKKLLQTAAAGLLLASVVTTASAASYDINFANGVYRGPADSLDYNYGNDQTMVVSGLSNYWGPYTPAQVIQQNYVDESWGLYVTDGTHGTSNVTVDNYWKYQALVFDFGQAVSLDKLDIGWAKKWHGNGLSILGLTDLNAPLDFNTSWSGLLDNGWEHAGNPNAYNNVSSYSSVTVQGGLLSRYWLIGAINPAFGADKTYWEDAFKLKGMSFTVADVSEVPLPAAAWLFLTGLAGMGWMKKRKAKREAAELSVA